jgi:hypothetical protein
MSGQGDNAAVFTRWADTVLAGSGYSAATVGHAESSPRTDLVTTALADGFAAATWGMARQTKADER